VAHYALFFSGADAPDDSLLDRAGLGPLRNTGVPIHWHRVLRDGPDGHDGMICCWYAGSRDRDADPSNHASMLWYPAKPDKTRSLDAGRFWYGYDPARPPVPHDLALPRRYPGYDIECADGHRWHIPAAIKLPHEHGLNGSGEWERRIARQYQAFFDRAMQYGVHIFSQMDAAEVYKAAHPEMQDSDILASVTLEEADKHCCDALMLNYRLTPEIIDFLGLLNDTAMFAIISATIDLPQIHEIVAQKKTGSHVAIRVG
jgi:hypothetical protein